MGLELRGISKRLGGRVVIDNASLDIRSGEMVCLLGPSGCGKTTSLRIIAGLETADSGAVRINGRDVTSVPPEKRNIGLVFQNYALFPHLTVADNIAFGLKLQRLSKAEVATRVTDALALVRLSGLEGRYPQQLSGGQQQRVALARALSIKPQLLLLDEPLSNLDAKLRDEMREEIRRLQTEVGITTVFVTHDQEEALSLADRVAVMNRGKIVQVDAPHEMYERPEDLFVAGFLGRVNRFPGKVLAVHGQTVELATDLGPTITGIRSKAINIGDAAVGLVRPERIRLAPAAAGGTTSNAIEGRVVSANLLGSRIFYRLDCGRIQLEIEVTNRQSDRFGVGDRVHASWDNESCLFLANLPIET
jgi:putative spermidine/putrescine transport system ATP-binding protein